MNRVENIKGCILADIGAFKEFKVSGLLLPKDEVSRNGVLYDWDSAKAKAKQFEGVPMNYNHIIDDDKPPVGKITKINVKEEADEFGPAGLYYEADIDEDSEYASSIQKGFLNKVSLQVTADAQKEEEDADGNAYTRAWIKDPLEVSVVKVPGFNQTTMEVAIAEAFKGEGLKSKKGLKSKGAHREDHVDKGIFPTEEFQKGLKIETEEHPDLNVLEAGQLVLDHLKEDEYYYSKEEAITTGSCPSKTMTPKKKEFKVVDIVEVLTDEEAKELVEYFSNK